MDGLETSELVELGLQVPPASAVEHSDGRDVAADDDEISQELKVCTHYYYSSLHTSPSTTILITTISGVVHERDSN